MTLRCFIAIELSGALRVSVLDYLNQIPKTAPDFRWVRPEHLHVTLRFLGSTPESKIQPITDSLSVALKHFGEFQMNLAALGGFPSDEKCKVLWLGLGKGADVCERLTGALARPLALLGFSQEAKPFKPHLTIARSRSGTGESIRDIPLPPADFFPMQEVRHVQLFRSTLTSGGPVYTKLAAIPL